MKKILSFALIIITLITSPIILSGCFFKDKGKDFDGVNLSNVKIEFENGDYDNITGQLTYNIVYSCTIKNTTENKLEFEIYYGVRFALLSDMEYHGETITLNPKETKKLTYTRDTNLTNKTVYGKTIKIESVRVIE